MHKNKIKKIIIDNSNPAKIILFGSRAIGREAQHIDYDFLIIVNKIDNERKIYSTDSILSLFFDTD